MTSPASSMHRQPVAPPTVPEPVPMFDGRPLPDPTEPAWDQGLAFDVQTLLNRRQVLKIMGLGAGAVAVAACTPGATSLLTTSPGTSPEASATPGSTIAAEDCLAIPEETAGPYPGDGSNGPDVLNQSGVVRSDIRSSFGSSTTTASGVPLTIRLAILDLASSCAPYAGAAVYLWHCDQAGRYSMYSQGVENENYLRGVQAAGDEGVVTFESIFPAAYTSRWPHIHFEVYASLDAATDPSNVIATSQIALPEAICGEVYATAGYESSIQNMSGSSLEGDMVFGEDGGARQLGTMSGTVAGGLTVELAVPVG